MVLHGGGDYGSHGLHGADGEWSAWIALKEREFCLPSAVDSASSSVIALVLDTMDLHTEAKWSGFWHFEQVFPKALHSFSLADLLPPSCAGAPLCLHFWC